MAHAQKPDLVFQRNGRVHLNWRARGSVQSTTGSRGVRISGSNAGYTVFRGSVKSTDYAQKADFVFRRNGRVHLNRCGASVQSTAGRRVVRISVSNAGYTVFRGSAKSTDYPLYSSGSPLLLLPRVTVCHHISTRVYRV